MTPRTYRLARTYAPAADFTERLARICPDSQQLCKAAGIATSTYARMVRMRTASRQTAERVAQFYALADGHVNRRVAFAVLFVPKPPKEMCVAQPAGASARRRTSSGSGAQTPP